MARILERWRDCEALFWFLRASKDWLVAFISVLLKELSLLADLFAQGLLLKRFAALAGELVKFLDRSVIKGLSLVSL